MRTRKTGAKLFLLITVLIPTLAASTMVAGAVACPGWVPTNMCDAGGNLLLDPNSIVRVALYLIIVAGILWTLWNIISAGFVWASSGGDEEKRNEATKKIISALVGLLIIVVSFTIMAIVVGFLGFETEETTLGIPCVDEKGTAGLWVPEYDLDNDGEIDKNECKPQ